MADVVESRKGQSHDSDRSRLRSKWSSELLAQTFSAGSVDICQVIRSERPPMVPLRMEMRCDGFETVRTKRKTIKKCIDKIDKAKELLLASSKENAVSYDAYNKIHEEIKRERDNQLAFHRMNSSGSFSRSSSNLLQESFSAGSVDICQVIRSDNPPPVPLRMELRCDGFETVRTRRKTIKRCIKKLEIVRKQLLEAERQSAVSYNDYVETHDEVRARRRATLTQIQNEYISSKQSSSTLGAASEDYEVNQREMRDEKEVQKHEEQTDRTLPSSNEWTTSASQGTSTEDNPPKIPYYESFARSSESNEEPREAKPLQRKSHELLFDEDLSIQKSGPETKVSNSSMPENDPPSEGISYVNDKQLSNDSSLTSTQYQKQETSNVCSFSTQPSIKSISNSDEMISYSMGEKKGQNLSSEMGSTIITTSDHRTLVDPVIITFSSESTQEKKSDNSYQQMNSMYTPDISNDVSFDSSPDDGSTDRYKSTESKGGDCDSDYNDRYECAEDKSTTTENNDRVDDKYESTESKPSIIEDNDDVFEELQREINYLNEMVQNKNDKEAVDTVDTDDSDSEYIPLSQYNFAADQYVHYIDPTSWKFHHIKNEQYHYVENKYRYSNLEEQQQKEEKIKMNDSNLHDENAFFCAKKINCNSWCEEEMAKGDNAKKKKKSEKRKKKKKKKKEKNDPFTIEEIVIDAV